jgi:exodeoxyribonuclease X
MYYFFGDEARDKIRNAHNALCDVENCLLILDKLLRLISDKHDYPEEEQSVYDNIEDLYNFSEHARIPTTMHFGKHYGKTYLEVAKTDPGYFTWWETKSDTPPDVYQQKAIKLAFLDKRKG